MPIERQSMLLAQWFSPAFPVGGFAYSHGLEAATVDGTVRTAEDLLNWLSDLVDCGTGRNDCILLRAAHGCDGLTEVRRVDAAAQAFAASAERLLEARLQGAAFARTTARVWDLEACDATLPVAVGYAARQMGLSVDLTASMYLHAFCSNLISAAMRLAPIGQTEGQVTLAALAPVCQTVARDTQGATLDDLQSTVFLSDICAMRHETLEPRIFRS